MISKAKLKEFLKTNKAIISIAGVAVGGSILTVTLVEVLPDPRFVVDMMNVEFGPQNFEWASNPNQDGVRGGQCIYINRSDGSLAEYDPKINGIQSDPLTDPLYHSTNEAYRCEVLGKSYDGGDIPRINTIPNAPHSGQWFVKWEIKQDTGMKMPDWLHIWSNEDDDTHTFGKLYWDVDKIHKETSPTTSTHLYLIITATLSGKTAESNDLHFCIKADS